MVLLAQCEHWTQKSIERRGGERNEGNGKGMKWSFDVFEHRDRQQIFGLRKLEDHVIAAYRAGYLMLDRTPRQDNVYGIYL